MDRRMRDLKNMLEELGVDYKIQFGGKHYKVEITGPGGVRHVPVSISPSCAFAAHKVRRAIRRKAAEIGALPGGSNA